MKVARGFLGFVCHATANLQVKVRETICSLLACYCVRENPKVGAYDWLEPAWNQLLVVTGFNRDFGVADDRKIPVYSLLVSAIRAATNQTPGFLIQLLRVLYEMRVSLVPQCGLFQCCETRALVGCGWGDTATRVQVGAD
jgi:hypothetical protein